MRFTLVSKSYDYDTLILDSLRELLGSGIKIVDDEEFHVIYHEFSDVLLINNLINDLSNELFINLKSYTSYDLDYNRLNKELNIAVYLLSSASFGAYTLKSILGNVKALENKTYVLDFIIEGSGVTREIINAMALADLNVTKASKMAYVHRNTLIYKLDRLKTEMDFDLRSFIDEYLLYSLL